MRQIINWLANETSFWIINLLVVVYHVLFNDQHSLLPHLVSIRFQNVKFFILVCALISEDEVVLADLNLLFDNESNLALSNVLILQ